MASQALPVRRPVQGALADWVGLPALARLPVAAKWPGPAKWPELAKRPGLAKRLPGAADLPKPAILFGVVLVRTASSPVRALSVPSAAEHSAQGQR
ncbi:MAG TPA: hypothetical protein VHB68_04025 [Steroidobacteraceae bacterium]|nr:hypothetical protein [Steroidobacteraceae bacterium]